MSEENPVTQEMLRSQFSKEDAYFHKLDEERSKISHEKAKVRRLVCRREGRPPEGCELREVSFHGVMVDRCETCQGLWLDPHELEALAQAFQKEAHVDTAPAGFFRSFMDAIIPKKS